MSEPAPKRLPIVDVFEMLRSERAYQDHLIEQGQMPNPSRSVGEFIPILNHYVRRVEEKWAGGKDCMVDIRKMTAVGVACLEQHGSAESKNPMRKVLMEARNESVKERPQIDFVEFLSQLVQEHRDSNGIAVREMLDTLGDHMDNFRTLRDTGAAS